MNLHKLLLTSNDCYKAGVKINPIGGMLHSTGANNPSLKRYVGPNDGLLGVNTAGNHWNTAKPDGISVCVHGFIGKLTDGTIATYQTLPWEKGNCYRGWHAGKSAGNNGYIGVEICEDGLSDSVYFNKVYKEVVELFAYLSKMHGWNPLTDILCHSEGYKKGIATNHSDVMHWFPKHGKSMDTFRAEVKAAMGGTAEIAYNVPETPLAAATSGELTVDGLWGTNTTKRLQQIFGTTVDGIVSNQYVIYHSSNPGLQSSSWQWKTSPSSNGSLLIKAIQAKVGVSTDGFIGPKTIKAIQSWMGTTQDGAVSNPSQCVKALQAWANKQ